MADIEQWLRTLSIDTTDAHVDELVRIKDYHDNVKALKEKEKTLIAIKAKCDTIAQHKDVQPMAKLLSDQLTIIIEVLQKQLHLTTQQIIMIEKRILEARKSVTPSEGTIGSSPMPDDEEPQHIEVETQTSLAEEKPVVLHTSMQTLIEKPTDNILVTQTTSEGHETIKIEYAQNPNVIDTVEDVFVDARYQQPNDPRRAAELSLRNVPSASFETTFVQPDDTTTEVIVDADGRKQIIVRKLITRTTQQQRIIEHQQRTIVETDEKGQQTITQANVQDESASSTVSDASGTKTVTVNQSERSIVTGETPENMQVVEHIVEEPQIFEVATTKEVSPTRDVILIADQPIGIHSEHQSSIETVVHHVTQQIVRRRKRIIRRVVIIDGQEHVTEEVVEEPDEIETIESSQPGINVNIVRNVITTTDPIVEMPVEEQMPAIEGVAHAIVAIDEKPKKKGKKDRAPKNVDDAHQVFELKPAPVVDLVNANAPVELSADNAHASSIDLNACITVESSESEASSLQTGADVIQTSDEQKQITNIDEIWPEEQLMPTTPASDVVAKSPDISEQIEIVATIKEDGVATSEIWPNDENIGNKFTLGSYVFEKKSPTEEIKESDESEKKSIEIELSEVKLIVDVQTTEIAADIESPREIVQSVEITKEIIETSEITSEPAETVEIVQETIEIALKPAEDVEIALETKEIVEQPAVVSPTEENVQDEIVEETLTQEESIEKAPPTEVTIQIVKVTEQITLQREDQPDSGQEIVAEAKQPTSEDEPEGAIVVGVASEVVKSEPIEEPKVIKSEPIEESKVILTEVVCVEETPASEYSESEKTYSIHTEGNIENVPTAGDSTKPPSGSVEIQKSESTSSIKSSKKNKKNKKKKSKGSKESSESIAPKEAAQELIAVEKILIEPGIVIDRASASHELEPQPLVSKLDVRAATKLFIENELNVSDATTRTVKVALSPLGDVPASPTSVTVKMKVDQAIDQPNLNVNIVEEYCISKPNVEKVPISVDPSVVESVELSIANDDDDEDDQTIADKMEMPEIEVTPLPVDAHGEVTIKTEIQAVFTPDGSYQTLSEVEPEGSVKIVEENLIQSPSESPKPLPVNLVIATEIVEEQQVEDVDVQTSPVQGESTPVEATEKPIVDNRSMQTSPEVKAVTDEAQQTTPTPCVEVENQTEVENVHVEIQTSPIPIGEEVSVRPHVETTTIEIQTDAAEPVDTSDKSLQAGVLVTDAQTSPRKTPTEEILANDIVPNVADQLVSGIVQNIPVHIEIKHESTTTEIIRTAEIDTQTPAAVESGAAHSMEPMEIHIETSFVVPHEELTLDESPEVIEITKTFIIDEKDPTKVTEVIGGSSEDVGKSKKSKSKQKKKKYKDGEYAPIEPETEHDEGSKSTQVTVSITKTTITDTFEQLKQREKEHHQTRSIGPHVTSTVTIEEVLSSNEDQPDFPVTPDADAILERPSESSWPTEAIDNENLLGDESSELPSTERLLVEWQDTNHRITDRIQKAENARQIYLSNVLHLATLSESITPERIQSHRIAVEGNLAKLDDAARVGNSMVVHETVIHTIEEISTWLETIEYRVYLTRQDSSEGPSDEKRQELNNLTNEISGIVSNVQNLSNKLNETSDLIEPKEQQEMTECVDNLKKQIDAVQSITRQSSQDLQNDQRRWNEYIICIETITTTIIELQNELNVIETQDTSIDGRLNQLDALERRNAEQLEQIAKNLQSAHTLVRDFPNKPLPVDIHAAYEAARNMENSIAIERDRLLQLRSFADEYEQTLQQFAQIIRLTGALVEQPIVAGNLDELHQEMQRHLKFFANLSQCRLLLQSLEKNIDSESREKHSDLCRSLMDQANQILEKASERSQRISLIASKWIAIERSLNEERQWLQMAEQRIPDLSDVSSADYERYLSMYKTICSDIAHHHAKLLHLANSAAQLQELVAAPKIQEDSNDCLSMVLKLKEVITSYSHRLTVFQDTWSRYETLTDRLEKWMLESERELVQIGQAADMHSPDTTRHFWEIRVHYEVNKNVRQEIINTLETSLNVLPIKDETLQRQFHRQLDERWTNITAKIEALQNVIVSDLSDHDKPIDEKLALIRRELDELDMITTSIKMIIKNEDDLKLYIERMQMVSNRVNIIFTELARLSVLPSQHPEQIGELFAKSHVISVAVTEQIENALILKETLLSIQKGIKRLQQLQAENVAVMDNCEACEKLDADQIEQAIDDCQHLCYELNHQYDEIRRLHELLHTLPMRLCVPISPIKLEHDLAKIQDNHAEYELRSSQLLDILKARLALWNRFERQLEVVQRTTSETQFMIDLVKVNGQIDYDRLKKTTERLEVRFFVFSFLLCIESCFWLYSTDKEKTISYEPLACTGHSMELRRE